MQGASLYLSPSSLSPWTSGMTVVTGPSLTAHITYFIRHSCSLLSAGRSFLSQHPLISGFPGMELIPLHLILDPHPIFPLHNVTTMDTKISRLLRKHDAPRIRICYSSPFLRPIYGYIFHPSWHNKDLYKYAPEHPSHLCSSPFVLRSTHLHCTLPPYLH